MSRVKFKGRNVSLIWLKRNHPGEHAKLARRNRVESLKRSEKKRQELIDAVKAAARECGERLTVAQARAILKYL